MAVTLDRIRKNLSEIGKRVSDACARSGRNSDDISLVAVTKTEEIGVIKHLIDAGVTDFGESRAQDLGVKVDELEKYISRRRNPLPGEIKWHMVGHVQRNKVKKIAECAGMVHSVDSLRLAEELNDRMEGMDRVMEILLQVNCSLESQKFGCAVGAALPLAESIVSMDGLKLAGLMTMGPMDEDPESSRNSFIRLRELFDEMKKERIGGDDFKHLSMGMSDDFEVAVEEGATIIRVGRALFQ